jgi:hypothetical protein
VAEAVGPASAVQELLRSLAPNERAVYDVCRRHPEVHKGERVCE